MTSHPIESTPEKHLEALRRWLRRERRASETEAPAVKEAEDALAALFALWPLPQPPATLVSRVMATLAARGAWATAPQRAVTSPGLRWAVAAGYLVAASLGLTVLTLVRAALPGDWVGFLSHRAAGISDATARLWGGLGTLSEVTVTVVSAPPVLGILALATLLALVACRWLFSLTGAASLQSPGFVAGGGSHAV